MHILPVVLFSVCSFAYILLLVFGIVYWQKKEKRVDPLPELKLSHEPFLSVLIPFRNEAPNLPALLKSLNEQTLNKVYWECIFIDDHSSDQGEKYVKDHLLSHYSLIKNQGTGKKQAIATPFHLAKGKYIVQTDADCILPMHWLNKISRCIHSSSPLLLAGPVCIEDPKTVIDYFQAYDFMAFMGMTNLGIHSKSWHLANGANLTYSKQVYEEMKKLDHDQGLASGDDMFLIEAAASLDKEKIIFIKDPQAIVKTQSIKDFRSLLKQRLRWGSKMGRINDWKIKTILAIPLAYSLLLTLFLGNSVWSGQGWLLFLVAFGIKTGIDYLYLKTLSPFFQIKLSIGMYVLCSLIYPFYLSLIFILSIFKRNYEWKGRISR